MLKGVEGSGCKVSYRISVRFHMVFACCIRLSRVLVGVHKNVSGLQKRILQCKICLLDADMLS